MQDRIDSSAYDLTCIFGLLAFKSFQRYEIQTDN